MNITYNLQFAIRNHSETGNAQLVSSISNFDERPNIRNHQFPIRITRQMICHPRPATRKL